MGGLGNRRRGCVSEEVGRLELEMHEKNQPDLQARNILEKIWRTLQDMLDEARRRGQQVLQSDLFKAALDAIPNNVAGYPAGGLVKVLVQLILLGLVSSSLSANCHMSHSTQRLAGAKQQVYDFTIEVVTDMLNLLISLMTHAAFSIRLQKTCLCLFLHYSIRSSILAAC